MNYSCGKYVDITLSQKQTMTAYEELKAWCEKHLDRSQWRATNEDEWGNPTIDIGEATHIFSQDTGCYLHTVFYN